MAARPARSLKARSGLVLRLAQAQNEPWKQRIRAWLGKLDDEQLRDLVSHLRTIRSCALMSRDMTKTGREGVDCVQEKQFRAAVLLLAGQAAGPHRAQLRHHNLLARHHAQVCGVASFSRPLDSPAGPRPSR